MSKNFELLQQAGNLEQLFRTSGNAVEETDKEGSPNDSQGSKPERKNDMSPNAESLPESKSERPRVLSVAPGPIFAKNKLDPRASVAPASPRSFPLSHLAGRLGVKSLPTRNGAKPTTAGQEKRSENVNAIPSVGQKEPPVRVVRPAPKKRAATSNWLNSMATAAANLGARAGIYTHPHQLDRKAMIQEEEIKLVNRVFPFGDPNAPRVALFSAAEYDPACTAICARTGELLAARGEGPVCVVDADFRSPALNECFYVENMRGLSEAIIESGPLQEFVRQLATSNLWLMSSGNAGDGMSLHALTEGLKRRITELREAFRYVVIHSGPFCSDTSSLLLSHWTDGVVIVVEANATRRDSAMRIKENLAAANVNVLGVVLNNRRFPIPEALYRRI